MSAIPRELVEDIHALSPVQQGMFFHTLLEPELAPYVEQGLWRLRGAVVPELFERAWNELAVRHTILRSVFRQARRQPVQIVLREKSIGVPFYDWTALPDEEQRRALRDLARSERAPFRLADGPLLRLALVRLGSDEWRLLWTFHHIILDGLTAAMLLESLCAIYDALVSGAPLPAPETPPFSNFIVWLARQDRDEAMAFWTRHLEGFAAPTPLPRDRPPTSVAGGMHRARHRWLSRDTSRALEDLARRQRVTVSTIMHAAWALLLARYSGEPDVVFGVTLAGRPADVPGVERIAGPFINTLPVRVQLGGDPRLADLLRALHQQFFDLDQYSYVSPADVQGRTPIRPPAALFESAINVHPPVDWNGFRSASFVLGVADEEGPPVGRTNYDLMIDVALLDTIGITISYVEEVFDEATIAATLANLGTLLEGIAACESAVRVSELKVVSPDERVRVLEHFNRTDPPVAFAEGVVARIETQAARTPDAKAVVAGGTRLSYDALNRRANQVAWWLRAAGVGREDRVAVFGERNAGWLTFVLGILKAGAAFVPLDPLQPDARLASIVSSSRIRVMACGPESAARALMLAPAAAPAPAVVCWDAAPPGVAIDDAGVWAGMAAANPPRVTGPRDLACVFFTSGSTGVPKGVMVEHAGMLNHHAAKIAHLGIDASSVVAQNASIGFDISVWQMLAALEAGGCVAIYGDETAFDQSRLAAGVARDGVTILETVPSLMDSLIEAASGVDLTPLRVLVSNAEFLPVPLCRRWLERFPDIPLVNTYGPTECSDDTAHHWQREAPPGNTIRIPIGRPIPGARIYILDRKLQPVPIGAPGEIAMGGVDVGRGYQDDPVRTALAFVPDPFVSGPESAGSGARMYLSGDIGRWTHDGVLEWIRRDGDQVKVRGHRVELGEIEAALLRFDGIRQAVAVVRASTAGEPQIVAYWLGDDGVDPARLRESLAAALPRYMLPAAIMRLEAFPVTSNGKLNRRALPPPPEDQAETENVAPADPIEQAVADIWSEVLGVARVGATDNFFELGGQSLKTLQIRSRLAQRFDVEIPLRAIFLSQTVRDQARVVAEASAQRATPLAAIPRLADADGYPLSHAQRRLWFVHQLDPADTSYILLAPVVLEGRLDLIAFERAWSEVVARQASLRTTFATVNGEPVQRIDPDATHRLSLADLSALPVPERVQEVERILAETRNTPFTLETPPVRALLLTLTPERHLFALVLHHLVSDGWSGDVLLRDLLELYRAARTNTAARLAPMPIRYVDYAAWQNARSAAGAFADDDQYWIARLSGELPALDLPAPRHGQPAAGAEVHAVTFAIDAETAERVRQVTADRDVTPFMLRLALVKTWLARVTGADDLLIGSPVAGRDRSETEALVGFFVNLLPLRTSLAGDPSFARIVDRVKRSCLEAYAHQDYPFDELVRRLNPERHAHRVPIFDVMFMSGSRGATRTVEGLTIGAASAARDRAPMVWPGATLPVALLVTCLEDPDHALSWTLTFDAQRIDRETAERAAAQFETILRAVARRPRARLSALDVAPASEQEAGRLRRRADRDEYPLSLAQRHVWTESRLQPGSAIGTLTMRVSLEGPLERNTFVDALQSVAGRHEAFRLTFGIRDGKPFQRVGPEARLSILSDDLASLSPAAQEDFVRAAEDDLASRPFDLSAAPLARAALFRLGPDRHLLVLAWHRLVVDAERMSALLESIGNTYARILTGEDEGVADAAAGPTDVALWQEARLTSGCLNREANYWRRTLQRAPANVTFPVDWAPKADRTFRAATFMRAVPPETMKAIRALARAHRTTPLRIVTAAFALLTSKLTRQNDCVLAVQMSARPRGAASVGPFLHDVPVAVRIDGAAPFETLLADVTGRITKAHDRREFAAALDSTEADDPRRRLITMAVSRARRIDRVSGSLRMRAGVPLCAASPYDLSLTLVEGGGASELHLIYAAELFDADTVTRWSDYLIAALSNAVAEPGQRLDRVGMLPAGERDWLVDGVNAAAAPYPATESLHRLFEAEAEARPHAPALSGGGREWTYGALNRDANRLARRLVAAGVGPGMLVAAFLDRSPEFVVAVLAIVKTGAAYLPLDPGDPPERLRVMLEDAGTPPLVTSAALMPRIPDGIVTRAIALDRDADAIAAEAPDNLGIDSDGESLCHVMYTSGSTGRPKGVMLPHRSVTHFARDTNWAALTPADRVAQMSKCSFDASTWEIWGSLLNGACLVTIPPDTVLSPAALGAAFDDNRITAAAVTPALFNQIARETPGCFRRMRYLFSGGDVMNPQAARLVLDRGAPGRLINVYGPTENSSLTTYQVVDAAATESAAIPVGRPITNTQVYIVDSAFQPVGVGIPGEVCVGGAGLAHGYWQQPGLTAQTFIPDPLGRTPGARLYATGDLARWRADGSIDFIGRVDYQVKIRGHRVEFGEIEAVLRRHEDVADAVVVVREGRTDVKQLAAYVVPVPGAAIAPDALRRYLSARLPSYMAPAWIVPLASLPLTATRKVDRRALPAPDDTRAALGVEFAEPRTALEAEIAAVWRQILRLDQVGIHDNFFDLGGDSIQCIMTVAHLAERGIRTTPKACYANPTVAALAVAVESATPSMTPSEAPLSGPVPLVPVQRFILEQDYESLHHWNVGALVRAERLDAGAVERALQAILDHHDALRMRFSHGPDGWQQQNPGAGEAVTFEVIDLGDDAERLTPECARVQASLDLTRGPVFRSALFRLADNTDRLLVITHHLVNDIVSSKVLGEDLARAYDQALRGVPIELPAKTTSYGRWAQTLEARAPERLEELPVPGGPSWSPAGRRSPSITTSGRTRSNRWTAFASRSTATPLARC